MAYDGHMTHTTDAPSRADLLHAARSLPKRRLVRLMFEDRVYFVKMAEQHASLRWRLQKGDPKAAFERERTLLSGFRARGGAVPEIAAEDDQRIILADHGRTLDRIIAEGGEREAVLKAAGKALADLHAKGLAHGRPSLRDLCWDGHSITFLDLEAGARLRSQPHHQARDLFLLVHSAITSAADAHQAGTAILTAYRLHGDPAVWRATCTLARRLGWLEAIASPVIWWHTRRRKHRSEFIALRKARRLIQGHDGPTA